MSWLIRSQDCKRLVPEKENPFLGKLNIDCKRRWFSVFGLWEGPSSLTWDTPLTCHEKLAVWSCPVYCAVCYEGVSALPEGCVWHLPPWHLVMCLLTGTWGPNLLCKILVAPTSETSHPRGKPELQWRCCGWEVPARGHGEVGETLANWDHELLQGEQGARRAGVHPKLPCYCEWRKIPFISCFTSSFQKTSPILFIK